MESDGRNRREAIIGEHIKKSQYGKQRGGDGQKGRCHIYP